MICFHILVIYVANFGFSLRCTFNSSRPRWVNTRLPNTNSSVHFFATVADINSAGAIRVDIENIDLNVGGNANETSSPSSKASPVKRRKFNAIAMNVSKYVFQFLFLLIFLLFVGRHLRSKITHHLRHLMLNLQAQYQVCLALLPLDPPLLVLHFWFHHPHHRLILWSRYPPRRLVLFRRLSLVQQHCLYFQIPVFKFELKYI